MPSPRLEINLSKIHHNARSLVSRLADRGISVTAVTKAMLGSPEMVRVLLAAGVAGLGDSRIENIEAMRRADIQAPMTLIRSPMLSQIDRIVTQTDISFNTELDVLRKLSWFAQKANRTHGVVLMVELGDLREGIMPDDLESIVRKTLGFPNIAFKGIGANLACRSGVSPDAKNMAELSALTDSIETTFGLSIEIVSGGNSANLPWAFSCKEIGRINNLRLGESILLGREPVGRQPIVGLYTDAITLMAEVIESKVKPTQPWGEIGESAFGAKPQAENRGKTLQSILAIGVQDADPCGLQPAHDIRIVGASSDHLVIESDQQSLPIGNEIPFQLNYSALVRLMTSPFVAKVMTKEMDAESLLIRAETPVAS